MNLQELGFTKEELQERVVEQAVRELFTKTDFDEDGNAEEVPSSLHRKLNEKIQKLIDDKVSELAAKHVLPHVSQLVENLSLQKTTEWGEKKGQAVTFIEYLIQRAEYYLREEVDCYGKSKSESDRSYDWRKSTTRIAFLVDRHLNTSIETAMKSALVTANKAIVGGIEDAVKLKLGEVAMAMKVSVTTK